MNFQPAAIDDRRTILAPEADQVSLYLQPEGTLVPINLATAVSLLDQTQAAALIEAAERDAQRLAGAISERQRAFAAAPSGTPADVGERERQVAEQLTLIGHVDALRRIAERLAKIRGEIKDAESLLRRRAATGN